MMHIKLLIGILFLWLCIGSGCSNLNEQLGINNKPTPKGDTVGKYKYSTDDPGFTGIQMELGHLGLGHDDMYNPSREQVERTCYICHYIY